MLRDKPRLYLTTLASTCMQTYSEIREAMDRFLFRSNIFILRPGDKFLTSSPDAINKIERIHLDINIAELNLTRNKLEKAFARMEDLAVNVSLKGLWIDPSDLSVNSKTSSEIKATESLWFRHPCSIHVTS